MEVAVHVIAGGHVAAIFSTVFLGGMLHCGRKLALGFSFVSIIRGYGQEKAGLSGVLGTFPSPSKLEYGRSLISIEN